MNTATQSQEVSLQEKEQEVIAKKRATWATLGEGVYHAEQQLQLRASKALSRIKHPATIQDVPAAEALLKELRAEFKAIETERKVVTSKFDFVTIKLMQPEKSLVDPSKALNDAIVKVKLAWEADEKKRKGKLDEEQQIIERIKRYLADADFKFRTQIAEQIAVVYEMTLSENVKPAELDKYLKNKYTLMGPADFQLAPPQLRAEQHTAKEIEEIVQKHFNSNPHAYAGIYQQDLADKFSDYSIAFQNKEAALARAEKDAEEKRKQLEIETTNKKMEAALDAGSKPYVSVAPVTKQTKKIFVVNMEECEENALKIIAGYQANRSLCFPKMSTQNWFQVTPASMAIALGKVKTEDPSFSPVGITFKETAKL